MRNRIKVFVSIMLCICFSFLCFALVGCGGDTPPSDNTGGTETPEEPETPETPEEPEKPEEPEEPEKPLVYSNILQEPSFEKGFGVKGQKDGFSTVYGYFRPIGGASGRSAWSVAQWYSGYFHMQGSQYPAEYNILKGEKKVDGTYQSWTDASKIFGFDAEKQEVYLELNASKEYTAPRTEDDPWPHLLVEYTLEQTNLSSIDGLRISFNYTLDKVENKMSDSEYDSGKHAAQLVFYVVVKNTNAASKDAGKYFWFGIPMYDNRNTALQDDSWSVDLGSDDKLSTNAFIYQMGSRNYLEELPQVGKTVSVQVEVMDKMKKAFDLAVEYGYLLDSKWEDMSVTNGNYGFELPGSFDVAATVGQFKIESGVTES